MASALIGALRVTLGLDSAAFEKGANRTVKKMGAVEKAGFATGRALRGIAGIAITAGAALATVFSTRAVKDALDYAASIGEVATALGVTQRELQVYRFAATQVNLTNEELEKGLAKLTLTIGKAATGAILEAQYFRELGIEIKDANGNIRPTGEILLDVAEKIQAIPDPATRAAAAYSLFGRAGQKLLPLLENGAAGLEEFGKAAEEAGVIIADGDIAQADKTADKIEALTTQLKVNFSGAVARNADAIYDLATAIGSLIEKLLGVAAWFAKNRKIAGLLFGGAVGGFFGGVPGAIAGGAAGFFLTPEGDRTSAEIEKQIKDLRERGPVLAGGSRGVLGDLFTVRGGDKEGKAFTNQINKLKKDLVDARLRETETAASALTDFGGDTDLGNLLGPSGGGGGGKSARDELGAIREQLAGLGQDIETAFDTQNLPESIEAANDLRQKLIDIADDARKAGVPMSQFADQVAVIKTRINELELEGLDREAAEFAKTVEDTARSVTALDQGALTPLEAKLVDVDDRFGDMRERIQEMIDENSALAAANEDAARSMEFLVAMLGRLDSAHRKAAEAARAQHAAEQELRDLMAQQAGDQIRGDISSLGQARGDAGVFTSNQLQLQDIERTLNDERLQALIQLRDFEKQLDQSRRAGDQDEAARLAGLVALQQEYYDLVADTTAQQIVTAERLQSAFEDFTNGLSDALYDMVTQFDFSLRGIADVFLKLLNDIFLRPALDSIAGSVGGLLQGLFAGGFATGGVIPRGQWGIVGEAGPEPVFAGDAPLNVLPNDTLGGGAVFNITVQGAMSDRDARRTGNQIGAAAANSWTRAQKAGLAG